MTDPVRFTIETDREVDGRWIADGDHPAFGFGFGVFPLKHDLGTLIFKLIQQFFHKIG